jgi:hypothetical protein
MAENEPEFSLTDTFNALVKKAVADFPELKGRFAIYSVPTETLHGSLENDLDRKLLLDILRNKAQEWLEKGFPVSVSSRLNLWDEYYAMIYRPGNCRVHTSKNSPHKSETRATATHELGHLIAPAGSGRPFSEEVAEIFSIIYQQLQYSTAKEAREQIDVGSTLTAKNLIVENDTDHFDLPVLQELKRILETYGAPDMPMTPVQAANFAYRLSLVYAPSEESVKQLTKYFEPANRPTLTKDLEYVPTDNEATYMAARKSARMLLEDSGEQSSLAFMTAKAFLEPYLDKRDDLLQDWTQDELSIFDGEFWDSVREKIAERTRQEEPETTEQRLAHEAKDMLVFGRFDRDPDRKIDTAIYESAENMAYLHRAMKTYAALRLQQPRMDQEQFIVRARKLAEKAPRLTSTPPRKTPAAI